MRVTLLRLLWVILSPLFAVLSTVAFVGLLLLYLIGVVLPWWIADRDVPDRVEGTTVRALDWLVGYGGEGWWYARLVPRRTKGVCDGNG